MDKLKQDIMLRRVGKSYASFMAKPDPKTDFDNHVGDIYIPVAKWEALGKPPVLTVDITVNEQYL